MVSVLLASGKFVAESVPEFLRQPLPPIQVDGFVVGGPRDLVEGVRDVLSQDESYFSVALGHLGPRPSTGAVADEEPVTNR
jgi:hypothetical protein